MKFVILLVFFSKLYEYSDFCTKAFQKSTETVSSCLILLAELRERFVNFEFYKVGEYAKELFDKYAIENFDVRGTTRKRSLPESLRNAYLTNSVGHLNASKLRSFQS